ncbi:Transportin-3 [Phytophthora pseudosyringae]|uniref:Transportin-3 n=1 Tax=Phytophthora pseudosyringae TaxID=221518 RepID=A0A8T1WCC2_9STRA|nr:Transportin-3 [Phytophthora pseudosyringae]
MDQVEDGTARRKPLAMATDEQDTRGHTLGLQISGSPALGGLDVDFLVPGEMELQTGTLVDESLHLNACGVVGPYREAPPMDDDLDMTFLSDLLQPERAELLPTSNGWEASSRTADSPTDSDAADTSSSTEEPGTTVLSSTSPSGSSEVAEAEPERELKGRLVDRKARRRAQVASSARRLRCRKKYEMMTLKTEASSLEQQLETLRSKHKQMRANTAVAAWEERAIAQRHKRRQAEEANEQLRQALFQQSGFVRNLRSMFSEAMPCSIELNMRNFLHTPTRLLKDELSRVRNLERVCTDAKLDMAKQIIMEETGGVKPFTTPHITCQQIDLGRDGFGMTTVAVYALETRNACKTFKATCNAILNCTAVWPNYTLVTSSLQAVELPPTKLNIRYGMSHNIYESDVTGDRVSVESREISYYRMTEDCGIFLWDYVDADDMNLLQKETTAMRCTIGAVLVRPEICMDGVERIVCRNICTKVHLADSSELTPSLERFSKSRQLCARICGSLVYETIKTNTATSSY